jgi:hypothetical protein
MTERTFGDEVSAEAAPLTGRDKHRRRLPTGASARAVQ